MRAAPNVHPLQPACATSHLSLSHPAGKTDVPPELAQELLEVADQYMLETL